MSIHSDFDMEGICLGGIEDRFAAAANSNKVRLFHLSSGELICTLDGHESPIGCVCWNLMIPTMLVSGGEDGLILLWGSESELADGEEVQPMIGED
ncbi:hypothetical protein CASFOL_015060 [Castilleja foliolosa]|uniref:Uncharacterized protein n=1 Tax=Castilleja foliolosa TaxID=1961234 RepID=A0ABD3DDK1_9LAMI